jgi:hypothetical protein
VSIVITCFGGPNGLNVQNAYAAARYCSNLSNSLLNDPRRAGSRERRPVRPNGEAR